MAKNFWENDELVQQQPKLPWEADVIVKPAEPKAELTLSPEEQMMSSIGDNTSTGYVPGSDTAKLVGAGALPILGAPEGIEAAAQNRAAQTAFAPMDIINQLANPQNVANKIMSGELFIPKKVQENLESRGVNLPKPFVAPEKDLIQLDRAKAALDETLSEGKIPQFKDLSLWAEKSSKALMDDLSPEMKDAIAMSTPTGDLVKAFDTMDFSGISLGKDPSALGYYGQFAKVFGSAAPVIVSTLVTKSPTVGATVGFGQSSAEGVTEAREFIGKMSSDELYSKSEYFRNLIAMGYDDKQAKQMTIDKAGNTAAEYQGIVGAFGGKFTGDLVSGKLAGKIPGIKSRLGRALVAGPVGMGEEAFQEYMEGIATDVGIDKTVVREMGADSFANALLGLLGGAGQGSIATIKELATPSEKADKKQPPTSITPVIAEPLDTELVARATMMVDSFESGEKPLTARNVNKLARDLGLEPAKNAKPEETLQTIKDVLGETLAQAEAPFVAPAEDTIEKPAAERPKAPTISELWNEFNQKIESLRPRKAPELAEPPAPVTVGELEADQFEETPVEQPEFKAPEPVEIPAAYNPEEIIAKAQREFKGVITTANSQVADDLEQNLGKEAADIYLGELQRLQDIAMAEREARKAQEVVKEEAPKSEFDVSKVASAAVDSMYKAIFEAQQQGKTKVAGIEDSVLRAAKNEGITFKSPEEVQDFAQSNENKIKAAANQIRQERLKKAAEATKPAQAAVDRPTKPDGKPLDLHEWWDYNKVTQEQLRTMPEEKFQAFRKKTDEYYGSFEESEAAAEEVKPVETKPAYTPPKLRTDNPGGNWLENKRKQSIEDGKKEFGVPIRFGAVTGYFREGNDVRKPLIPVDVLAKLQGMNNEQQRVREKSLDAIKKIMDETGRLPPAPDGEDYVPFINVYQDGTPYVNEGNHRIMAAKALGFKYLPVEISYFNGAEQIKDGVLSPESVITYDMQANDDGFSKENYRGEKKAEETKAKPEVKVTANKVFTDDAAEKARALLKKKLNQLNSGIDPEVLQAGIILSGYHVEKGARTFAAYSAAMIKDLGDAVKPYLKSWYMALKYDPRSEEFKNDMDSADVVDKFEYEAKGEFPDLMTPEGKFEVAKRVTDALMGGAKYDNIAAARQFIKSIIGRTINPGTAEAKEADEAIETGVVMAARQIVEERNSPQETYDKLVDLYNRQPNLTVRTSTSIKEQAYSTPAPLAYIASQLAGIDNKTTVYEPTAGNGMLLIGADPKKVIANELNATRFEMLKRVLPGAEVVNKDALKFSPELSDVVIANPPFGAIGEEVTVGGNTTREIDHAIAYKALGRMPANGRAVLIVGGVRGETEDARREGYRSAQKRAFYANLYRDYNVVDHFTVAGDLYKKQGAAYPVDVIVINGKGRSERTLPAADLPKVYDSYEQLKEKLDEASRMESRVSGTTGVDRGVPEAGAGEPQGVGRGAVGQGVGVGAEGKGPAEGKRPSVPEAGVAPSRAEPTGRQPSEEQPKPADESKRGRAEEQPVSGERAGVEPRPSRAAEKAKPVELGGPSVVAGERVESRLKDRRGEETETATQVAYEPHSQASAVGTLVPKAMRDAIDESLAKIEDEMGNLDEYVAQAIQMDIDTLRNNFSAEQIDALALAINNAEAGKGFIIGDQTGIGKGRVVAAMIKYALVNGKIPIFVTEKPNLYSDMIRDLDDIGMTKELALDTAKPKIFITNSSEAIPYQLLRIDKNGDILETKLTIKAPKSGKALEAMMKDMVKNDSLGDYKVIFTTYSQLQTIKGNIPERGKFIQNFGEGNYMIFDESHNAGGGAATRDGDDMTRAKFVRELVQKAFGTFFSSATYAKRPDVMDLYSSTDMKLAVDTPSELGDAIKFGGVPMQQIVATMLTRVGQYIRRERTFAGVAYDTQETKVDKQTAENMASAMRSVLAFSRAKEAVIKGIQKEFDKEAKVVSEFGGEGKTIQGANFGSVMHNLIDQMLLSLKAQDSVNHAIDRLKAGEKVVMTVSNTMGSFLQSYAEDMGIEVGGEVDLSFADLYVRYLDKQRMVTIRGPEGKVLHRLTDEELGPTLTAQYEAVKKQIMESGFGSAPISPIDFMHNELRKAGYKTDEITGRTVTLNYAGGAPVLQTRTANIKQRVGAVREFNNGELDVLILNQAGSTGLSLHAAEKVKDKRKRHMIIVQPEKNIDTHMQMLGRVHRTGQVVTPAYSQMMADIPAEMRPAAVLMKKMASLNANTTASRKSAVTAEGVVDFINEYGGQIVQEYLRDNPDVLEAIGGDKVVGLKEDATEGLEEDIRKFTGYIPILPIAQQAEIYRDLTERYNELIERENSLGTNKLEAKALDLDAETLSTQPITEDKGDPSLFAAPAMMEKVDVKRTVKPYSNAEVKEQIAESLDGKSKEDVARELTIDLRDRMKAFAEEQIAKAKEAEADPVKLQGVKDKLQLDYSKIKSVLDNYKIGDEISIKDSNGIYNYAVITDITNSKKTVNPSAGSDWKMHLAMANGDAKALTISFSQINTTYELAQEYYVDYLNPETDQAERVKVMEIFDKGATVRREKRWMITGNILAGFAQYPGQIISYTKKDGTLGQGVLMSRQFDFEKVQREAPVRLRSAGQAMRFLEEIGGVIGTQDNNFRVEKRGSRYEFVTPKSKRKGVKYYGDDVITSTLGNFNSAGQNMFASTYDQARAEKVIAYVIDQMGDKLFVKTGIEKARAMFAAPKLENIEEKQLSEMAIQDRKDTIRELSKVRRAGRRLVKQVAKYGSDIPMQRQLNELLAHEQNLKDYVDSTKVPSMTAEDFMARATEELAAGNITPEVERFIRSVYEKYPNILNGIKLSVRAKEGKGRATGNFDPIERLVTLWKGTSGVRTSKTARHELTHTMEQMMTPEARKAVIGAWARNLEAGMKRYKDRDSKKFFDAVLAFLENPTEETAKAATDIMPDYSYYEYLNPSEYWAVNAEKLFGQQLGGAWTRFVKAMEKMFEGLKAMFFMNNKLAVHRAFDQIIKKQPTRETRKSLADYLDGAKVPTRFLNQIEEDKNLIEDLGIPDVPDHEKQSFKDYMITSWNQVKDMASRTKMDPKKNLGDALAQGYDVVTKQRIEQVWFGAGLDKRDMERWGGQIRTETGRMVPSVAVKNDLRSAYIANAVIVHGGLEYSGKYGQFIATDRENSMGNVIRLQDTLRKRLGKALADKLINGWFVAARTRSIQTEYFERTAEVRKLQEAFMAADSSKKEEIGLQLQEAQRDLDNIKLAYQKVPYYLCKLNEKKPFLDKKGERVPNVEYDQDGLPILDDNAIDALLSRSEAHPELQAMMDNWTAVNHNMLDNMAFSGRISKPLATKLKKIKNYVPWYRIMDEQEDIYDSNKMQSNAAGVRHFKSGRTERDVDNVVESMLHNVAVMTRSAIRNYAYNRIATEYGERRPSTIDPKTGKEVKGRLRVYPETGIDEKGVRVPLFNGGRRVIINIPDRMVGDAYLGMSIAPFEFPLKEVLSAASQLSRRTITFSLLFQVRQVFYDAPTAALVSGSKKPFRLWGSALAGFVRSLEITKQDPTVQILRRAGIGGFRSHHRTAKKELALELGILTKNNWLTMMSAIDKVGDASDLSQRVAVKDRILKESGDPALALLMASEVMDFGKHGKSQLAAIFRSTITFMQAWATQLDTLYQAFSGGTLKGKAKEDAKKQFRNTMFQFMFIAGVYTFACLGDDDYDELDDQTKARNLYVPFSKKATGHHVLIPLHSTAAYFFKVVPELLINSFMKYNTEKEIDRTRFMTALYDGFIDSVLGPTPIPTGLKPSLEIYFDRNTYTGGTVVPKSLADVESAQQYTAATSELSKIFGEYTGISPVKMDHFIRGTFGTAGAMAQWFSNMIFSEGRVGSQAKEMPVIGGFVAPDVLKLNEQLYYDLKERSAKKYETWKDLMDTEKFDKADAYYEKNQNLIEIYGYVSSIEQDLKDINKQIRELGRRDDKTMSSAEKRAEVNELMKIKQEMLSGVIAARKEAGL